MLRSLSDGPENVGEALQCGPVSLQELLGSLGGTRSILIHMIAFRNQVDVGVHAVQLQRKGRQPRLSR